MKQVISKKLLREIIVMMVFLVLSPLYSCTSKVNELGPVGQEYVSSHGGSLTVEGTHQIRLWDGRGLPNSFRIKNGHFYNEYGTKVGTIRQSGDNIYIHSSNSNVQIAYGGTYKRHEGHFKGYQRL